MEGRLKQVEDVGIIFGIDLLRKAAALVEGAHVHVDRLVVPPYVTRHPTAHTRGQTMWEREVELRCAKGGGRGGHRRIAGRGGEALLRKTLPGLASM